MQWFVLRVQAGKEDKIVEALHKKLRVAGLEHLVGEILVPKKKETTTNKDGQLVSKDVKVFPGYIYLQAELYEDSDTELPELRDDLYFLIKETPSVGDFTGSVGRPTPMAPEDVDRLRHPGVPTAQPVATTTTSGTAAAATEAGAPVAAGASLNIPFGLGDKVRIRDGHAFGGFEGLIQEIQTDRGQLKVSVEIFGRPTEVELPFHQVEAIE